MDGNSPFHQLDTDEVRKIRRTKKTPQGRVEPREMEEESCESRRDSEERTAVGTTKVFEKGGVTGQGTGTETVRHGD